MSGEKRLIEVGPLRNQKHAEEVAAKYVADHPNCQWTGEWKTTVPGKMSVIERCSSNSASKIGIDMEHLFCETAPDAPFSPVLEYLVCQMSTPELIIKTKGATEKRFVEVGPLRDQKHAEEVGAKYVADHPHCKWTREWTTTVPGKMSVIEVIMPVKIRNVEVGPLRNQKHAKEVAEKYVADHPKCKWTGNWRTTVAGKMSVIEVSTPLEIKRRCVEVGPLRDHKHAKEAAAKYVSEHPNCTWTGEWKTTVPGKMSVIEVWNYIA